MKAFPKCLSAAKKYMNQNTAKIASKLLCAAITMFVVISPVTNVYAENINTDHTLVDGTYDNMTAGIVGTFEAPGQILGTMSGGTINNMTGGTIGTLDGGTIVDFYGGAITTWIRGTIGEMHSGELSLSEAANIINRLDGGTITSMSGGSIGAVEGGTVNIITSGRIENLNSGGTVKNLAGGTIGTINGGTLNTWTSGNIGTLQAGTVSLIQDNNELTLMAGGAVNSMTGGSIGTITGGTLTSLSGGDIGRMDAGTIANMSGGTLKNMLGGTVGTLNGGTIDVFNGGTINTFNNGTINTWTSGTINNWAGGTWTNLTSGQNIGTMSGGNITAVSGGDISTITGGTLGSVSGTANLRNIVNGTITGDVSNQGFFEIANGGTLNLLATSTAPAAVSRDLHVTDNAKLNIANYSFGGSTTLSVGDNGTVKTLTDTTIPYISFANGGTLYISSDDLGKTFNTVTLGKFNSASAVNFVFDADSSLAGGNSTLVINDTQAGAATDHRVAIGAAYGAGSARDTIDLITDNTGTLSFSLANGSAVGIGANNYTLSSVGNIWSLALVPGLSDAAKAVGSAVAADIISFNAIVNSLRKRAGSVYTFKEEDMWVRTYGALTKFEDLAQTKVSSMGVESGLNLKSADFKTGSLIFAAGGGVSLSEIGIDSQSSRDAGGNSVMPYAALYGTLVFDNGMYFDLIGRYAYASTDAYYYDGLGDKKEYSLGRNIFSAGLETGYKYCVSSKFTLEPMAEIIFATFDSDSFTDDAGYAGRAGRTNLAIGTIGASGSYNFNSKALAYGKLAYINQMGAKTDVNYDGASYKSNVSGGRFEVGAGASAVVKENFLVFGELVYRAGAKNYRDYSFNIGTNFKF
ncbi:outer membrane autotransporter protein [Elusimicrobium posterum]|uniref:autotransporter outer membrane beta-barrel domain-containing protein n=1 Tax=Elusimicrobium posterum TaxID=3116653 RepID=UPI003C75B068